MAGLAAAPFVLFAEYAPALRRRAYDRALVEDHLHLVAAPGTGEDDPAVLLVCRDCFPVPRHGRSEGPRRPAQAQSPVPSVLSRHLDAHRVLERVVSLDLHRRLVRIGAAGGVGVDRKVAVRSLHHAFQKIRRDEPDSFIIIAFSIFVVIRLITKLTTKKKVEEPAPAPAPAPAPEPSAEEKLLTEIRDLLKEKK